MKYQTLLRPTGSHYDGVDSVHEIPNYFVLEKASFQGLPFADVFEINTLWRLRNIPTSSVDDKIFRTYNCNCESTEYTEVSIFVDFHFKRSCWIKDIIKSSTKSELREVLSLWCNYATEILQTSTSSGQNDIMTISQEKPTKDTDSKSGNPWISRNTSIEVRIKRGSPSKPILSWWHKLPFWKRRNECRKPSYNTTVLPNH